MPSMSAIIHINYLLREKEKAQESENREDIYTGDEKNRLKTRPNSRDALSDVGQLQRSLSWNSGHEITQLIGSGPCIAG